MILHRRSRGSAWRALAWFVPLVCSTTLAAEQPAPAAPTAPAKAGAPPAPADVREFEAALLRELEAVRSRYASAPRPGDISPALDTLFDAAIAFTTAVPMPKARAAGSQRNEPEIMGALREIDALRRQVQQMGVLKPDEAAATRKLLVEHPTLARAVSGAIGPSDHVPGAYAVLRLLAEKFPDRVQAPGSGADDKPRPKTTGGRGPADLSALVAAFCIVYDGPLPAAAEKPAPIDAERVTMLFDHFSTNWDRLQFGGGASTPTPPELLVFVVSVDQLVTPEDIPWAFKTYASNRTVGKLYNSITYDTNHFKRGTPKKVEQAPGGTNLQNIRKFGGVCHEQALFAANVGRLIGVPAVYVSGRGADTGHAWVGYLKSAGSGRFEWDFDEGRHKEYQDVRGNVRDPRTGNSVSDGFIGLTAGLVVPTQTRELATALLDAAERLQTVESAKLAYPPHLPSGLAAPRGEHRALGTATQLALIEMSLRVLPSSTRGWNMIADMANSRRLSPEELRLWTERLFELCGDDFPDYALDAAGPMVRAVADFDEQDRLWQWIAGRYNQRKDLAAGAILGRADMWDRAKKPARAWELYNDVIERYANDGQIIVDALARAERFLVRENKSAQIVDLYAGAWPRISRPSQIAGEFTAASSYVAVGRRYADLLTAAGRPIDAKKVRDQIKQILDR